MQSIILIALLAAVAVVQALPASYGEWQNEGPLIKENNIKLHTIVEPTREHYSKEVSSSSSRRDSYERENTRTQTNLHQKIVTSDEYVKDHVRVSSPLEVVNVEHHNNHLTVKNVYPKHINTIVNRYKKIIKPQEGRTDSYSESESREKIVHPTKVVNREESVNLGTKVEPTQWVNVGRNYEGGQRNNEEENSGSYGEDK